MEPATKDELLNQAARDYKAFHETLAALNEAQMSYDDVDAWNARFAAAKKGASVADVLLEFDKSHEYFMHAAARVPADRFQAGKTAWKIVDGNSAHHYREHAEQIRAWRKSRGL